MKEPASYPGTVWNGLSDNPSRSSLNDDITPDTRDWDRIVAEVIATQTELDAVSTGNVSGLEAATESGNGAMTWQGVWSNATTYHKGAVVYAASQGKRYYVALRDTLNDSPEVSTSDWRVIDQSAVDVPPASDATGDPHNFYILANSSGNSWYGLESAMQTIMFDNTDMDNRFESYKLTSPTILHGTPVRLTLIEGVLGSGATDDAVVTANTALETDVFNGWVMYVVESPSGNRTNPVSVLDTPNNAVICTVPDTGNTTWNAIVTSWNSVQSDLVADLVAGDYEAGVTTTGNSTIQIQGGIIEEVRATTMNLLSGNVNEATVFGLCYNGVSADPPTPNTLVLIQTAGTMTFTADQTANAVDPGILVDGGMVVGEAYYANQLADNGPLINAPESANKLCVPIGIPISPTKLRLRLGLPVKTTVGA